MAELDLLEECSASLGHVRQGVDGLLVQLDHLPMGRASAGLVASEAGVADGLLPQLCTMRVVRQGLELLVEAIAVDGFEDVHHSRVKRAATVVEQAAVGDLVGERVLERVLELGVETRLVEEFGGLQAERRAKSKGEPTAPGTEFGDWITWARPHADRLDP